MQASFGAYQPCFWHGGKEEIKEVAGVHNTLDLATENDAIVCASLNVYTCSLCIHKLKSIITYALMYIYYITEGGYLYYSCFGSGCCISSFNMYLLNVCM